MPGYNSEEIMPTFEPTPEQWVEFNLYATRHLGKTVYQVHQDTVTEKCGAWEYYQEVKDTPWTVQKALKIAQLNHQKTQGTGFKAAMEAMAKVKASRGSPTRAFMMWCFSRFPEEAAKALNEWEYEEDADEFSGLTEDERWFLFDNLEPHLSKKAAEALLLNIEVRTRRLQGQVILKKG